MYKEYLAEFWYSAKALENSKVFFSIPTGGIFGEVWVNTFRNAIGSHYLPHSSEYVAPPSIDVVRQWFLTIGYMKEVSAKETLKKSLLPPRWRICQHILRGYHHQAEEETKGKDKPMVFKAPKTSSKVESVSQGTKPEAQTRHKKPLTSSKQPSVSRKEAIKGVTSKARANPQLSSGMPSLNLNEPVYLAYFIIHSEAASRNNASAASTAEADLRNFAPSTDPHVLAGQTKYVSEGLETILTQPITGKGANPVERQIKEETSSTIKLEDLAKLASDVQPRFNDMDSPKDDISLPTELKDLSSKFNDLTKENFFFNLHLSSSWIPYDHVCDVNDNPNTFTLSLVALTFDFPFYSINTIPVIKWIQRISLTGFPAQSVGSSNIDVLELPCLLVLITEMSQSKQHGTDISSLVNHNAYMASSSAPQITYAPIDPQLSEYSSPEAGLVLRTSSNPRQQATINNGRVTIQPIQGRQNFVSAGSSRPFTSGQGGAQDKQRVITCYNCKGEGYMSKQCIKPRRKRDAK
nr:hypothetical protein [Tanacetum cinerariifolium]